MNENKEYRFNHLGGQWYINTLKDLSYKYREKKENNEDFKDITKKYLELEQEYKEWEKWAKKEVKKRQKEAIERYLNNNNI